MQSRLGTGSVVQIQQVEVARTSIYYREVHTECQGEEPNVDQKLTSCEAIKTSARQADGGVPTRMSTATPAAPAPPVSVSDQHSATC